jgi:cyanophycinase-like exopeptidase
LRSAAAGALVVQVGEVMIHAADVREWRNRDVVDTESHKIGALEAVYVDTTTDEPARRTATGAPLITHRRDDCPVRYGPCTK